MSDAICGCDFEVFGIVQGVSFRAYTDRHAKELGIRGWCMNTANDTVKGHIEGKMQEFEKMQDWLQKVGSPTSRIDKTVFGEIKNSSDYAFETFSIRHQI